MAHSYSRNHIHLVFSTKERRNSIPKEMQPKLWAYIAGICKNYEMIAVAIGGTENHVHIFFIFSQACAKCQICRMSVILRALAVANDGIRLAGKHLTPSAMSVQRICRLRVNSLYRNQEAFIISQFTRSEDRNWFGPPNTETFRPDHVPHRPKYMFAH